MKDYCAGCQPSIVQVGFPHAARSNSVLGRDLDRCVKVDLPWLPSGRNGAVARSWNGPAVLAKSSDMEFDGPLDSSQCTVNRLARCDASRKIRNRRPPIAARIPIDPYQVLECLHHFCSFRPACRFTDPNVLLAISSPRSPLTVTRPGFVECLNCRWLPSAPPVIHLFDTDSGEGRFSHRGQAKLKLGKPLLQSNAIAMILGYWQPSRQNTVTLSDRR
jgi:hypothetical protein